MAHDQYALNVAVLNNAALAALHEQRDRLDVEIHEHEEELDGMKRDLEQLDRRIAEFKSK